VSGPFLFFHQLFGISLMLQCSATCHDYEPNERVYCIRPDRWPGKWINVTGLWDNQRAVLNHTELWYLIIVFGLKVLGSSATRESGGVLSFKYSKTGRGTTQRPVYF